MRILPVLAAATLSSTLVAAPAYAHSTTLGPTAYGYGVDIVLNSVTGAAQLAGIKLLALGGRYAAMFATWAAHA